MDQAVLNNGVLMPMLGYGTYQTPPRMTVKCVRDALEVGYRLIDTAQCYGNERETGMACRASGVVREDIFVTTKLWAVSGYSDTLRSIDDSLHRLDLGYIDLLLLHEPMGDIPEIYRAMETAYLNGKVRAIGVSNFMPDRLQELFAQCSVVPAVNQVETHVFRQQKALRDLEQSAGTMHQSWSPLASGRHGIFTNPVLEQIALAHSKNTAQIALRFLYQLGIPSLPKSTQLDHMRENKDIFDFVLSDDEMQAIAALDEDRSLFGWW